MEMHPRYPWYYIVFPPIFFNLVTSMGVGIAAQSRGMSRDDVMFLVGTTMCTWGWLVAWWMTGEFYKAADPEVALMAKELRMMGVEKTYPELPPDSHPWINVSQNEQYADVLDTKVLGVTWRQLHWVSGRVVRMEYKYKLTALSGRGKPITRSECETLRDKLIELQYLRDVGVSRVEPEATGRGRALLKGIATTSLDGKKLPVFLQNLPMGDAHTYIHRGGEVV